MLKLPQKGQKKDKSTRGKLKELDPNFIEEVDGLDSDKLKAKIVEIAKGAEDIKKAREDDLDLERAKEQMKVLTETYSVPLKATSLKTKYLVELLKEKGA